KPVPQLLTDEEIIRLARLSGEAGVTKIRLTGGEPLLRKDAGQIAEALGALPGLETLALTTNGLLLPKKLEALQKAGLNLLNISLDTLRQIGRASRRARVQRSVWAAASTD